MRFTQFLRRFGNSAPARALKPSYRLTIVGSSNGLQNIKSPLYQDLRSIGASVTRAQSSLRHMDEKAYTELTILCTADRPLSLNQLAQKLGQAAGIRQVQIDNH